MTDFNLNQMGKHKNTNILMLLRAAVNVLKGRYFTRLPKSAHYVVKRREVVSLPIEEHHLQKTRQYNSDRC